MNGERGTMKNSGDLEIGTVVEVRTAGWRKPLIALAIAMIVIGTPSWVGGFANADTDVSAVVVTTAVP
jgi:hypothetical protein